MMIDQLSQKTILVTLMRDDMERYCLDFSAGGDDTRRGLTRLMRRIGEECGLDHTGKSYLIEALPAGDSCLLIISVRTVKSRRRYRVKREQKAECCAFDNADALLDWMHSGGALDGGLYTYKGGYWLLPDYPFAPRVRARLSEYGRIEEITRVEAARIRELGTPVMEHCTRRILHPRSSQ